jgi:hypothetical protein
MKLGTIVGTMAMGALLMACAGPSNGGWMTKGGWDASSRAPASQPAAPTAKESLPDELAANPYAPNGPKPALDTSDPWDNTPSSSKAKAKTAPQKGDEAGW